MRSTSIKARVLTALATSGLLIAGLLALLPHAGWAQTNTGCTPTTVGSISNNADDQDNSTSGSGGCSASGTTVTNTGKRFKAGGHPASMRMGP